MHRWKTIIAAVIISATPLTIQADEFEYYTNKVLEKVPKFHGALKVKKLTPQLLVEHSSVLQGTTGTVLVVRTNEGRWSKLLVYPAQQKISGEKSLPIVLIDRFATYREGEDRTILVQGKNVRLFGDFRFNLDIGQIVPESLESDLHFVVSAGESYLESVGKAELYVLTKPMPQAKPDVSAQVVVGKTFQPTYYNGVYKLYDDGRRSGTLHLKVSDDGAVLGHFYSDKDGRKYEVAGRVLDPHHKIEFKIVFPRTVQFFHGWMFTGNGKALTGWARMENRESGFYALRLIKND